MRRDELSVEDIKRLLVDRLPELLARGGLAVGRPTGDRWTPRNPTRSDATPGSFVVYASGRKIGGFIDYATGEKGSVLDLAGYLLAGPSALGDTRTCVRAAKDFLGLDGGAVDPKALAAAREKAARDKHRAEADAARRAQELARRQFAYWLDCRPIEGTAVEAYLGRRGLPLASLADPPRALRFDPGAEWWRGAKRDGTGRKVAPGPRFPALVAAMSDGAGKVVATQTTFLTADGSKAPVDKVKLIWPGSSGAAIRLAKGQNRCSPEQAARDGLTGETLVLTEGIEDGLTAALAWPEARVWAACGINNLGLVTVPESVTDVVIGADNDWGKPECEGALARACERLARPGVTVRVARSAVGKDFNDWLRGQG